MRHGATDNVSNTFMLLRSVNITFDSAEEHNEASSSFENIKPVLIYAYPMAVTDVNEATLA